MSTRRVLGMFVLAFGVVLVTPAIAGAHPLGNFTINQFAGLRVSSDRVGIDYVVDMAEIPTFQTKPDVDANGDGTVSTREGRDWSRAECSRLGGGLRMSVDGNRFTLNARDTGISFPPGQAGLATLRIECRFDAAVAAASGEHTLTFSSRNFPERIGWREITVVGDGTTLRHSPFPTTSPSRQLTAYPADRLQSPLDQRDAKIRFALGGAAAPRETPISSPTGSVVRGFDDFTRSFTSSVSARRLTVGLALVALAIGLALGGLHAFAPGHGKTVMAAYLVGERGTVRDGLLIGVTVAATHTLGVLALGTVLTASQTFAPESVYPYLSLLSGMCFAGLGITLFVRARYRGRLGSSLMGHHHGPGAHQHHHHGPGTDHHHGPADDHEREPDPATDPESHQHVHGQPEPQQLSRRNLLALGFAGGLVPTPTAIIVLLGATAIGRAWFGVALVLAYGVGMAATLVAAGVLLARARRRFDLKARSERALRIAALFPVVTAVVITTSGLWLVARAATSL